MGLLIYELSFQVFLLWVVLCAPASARKLFFKTDMHHAILYEQSECYFDKCYITKGKTHGNNNTANPGSSCWTRKKRSKYPTIIQGYFGVFCHNWIAICQALGNQHSIERVFMMEGHLFQ